MTKRTYGRTKSGQITDDDHIEKLADEAEAGYDVAEIIARRGRPSIGSAPSTVESVPPTGSSRARATDSIPSSKNA